MNGFILSLGLLRFFWRPLFLFFDHWHRTFFKLLIKLVLEDRIDVVLDSVPELAYSFHVTIERLLLLA